MMANGKAVNPNAASRMSREQVGEALQLYRDTQHRPRCRVGAEAAQLTATIPSHPADWSALCA